MLSNIPNSNNLLSQNPAVVYISSLAPGSRRTMRQSLNAIAAMLAEGCDLTTFPWHQLRYQHTTAIRSLLQEKYAPATANKMLSALKRVLVECKRLELMSVTDCDRAIDLKPIKGNSPIKGRALLAEEVSKLVEVCRQDKTAAGVRDLAILSVLRVGLRRAEVVGLDRNDINLNDGCVTVRRGKGGKTRVVYLPESGIENLRHWLRVAGNEKCGLGVSPSKATFQENEHLFCAISKAGTITNRRLSAQSILTILNKRAEEAGIQIDFSCHDWRRTFIGDLLDAGVDIVTVQKMVGHSDPSTTARYDRRNQEVMKKAVSTLLF